MKKPLLIASLGILASLTWSMPAYAYTQISGEAIGQSIGLIDFDPAIDASLQPGIFDWADGRCSHIPSEDADSPFAVDYTWCELSGFAWSDTMGWLVWDGQTLFDILGATEYLDPQDFPRVVHNDDTGQPHLNDRKPLAGYVWSEHGGWIRLAADNDYGTTTDPDSQYVSEVGPPSASDWGVFIDYENGFGNPPAKLRGFAWSEDIGWIKFGPENATEESAFSGTSTNWLAEVTPPDLWAQNHAWFPNTLASYLVTWGDFMQDSDSALIDSDLTVTKLTSNGCQVPSAFNSNQNTSPSLATPTTDAVSLELDNVGYVQETDNGYCKFEIRGQITNAAGYSRYLYPAGAPEVASIPDPTWRSDPVVFYTRAGNPCPKLNGTEYDTDNCYTEPTLTEPTGSLIADGVNSGEYVFEITDIGGNPIVRVQPPAGECGGANCPERDVEVIASTINNMEYDATGGFDFDESPVYVDNVELSNGNIDITIPATANEDYRFDLTSYAPTVNNNEDALELQDYNVTIIDDPILEQSNIPPSPDNETVIDFFDNTTFPIEIAFDNPYPQFSPALVVQNGQYPSNLTTGAQTTASYELHNASPTETLDNLSIDHVFEFYSSSGVVGPALMEVHDIRDQDASNQTGRTDPLAVRTRYNLFNGSFEGSSQTTTDTIFHDIDKNLNPEYPFESEPDVSTSLNGNGEYTIEGIYALPPDQRAAYEDPDSDLDPDDLPDMVIDRSENISGLSLSPAGTSTPSTRRIDFTPQQWIEGETDDVSLRLSHLLAYRFSTPASQPRFTIYKPQPLVSNLSIEATGVRFSGIAAGQDIFATGTDRELNVLGAPEVRALKEQIRRNVASLTTGRTPCSANTTLSQLPLAASCVSDNDDEVIALYEGTPGDTLILESSSSTLLVPSEKRYTLIVRGGANVFIKSNVDYSDTMSSFGIITLQNASGEGGNVFIGSEPTNMVGNLFAEGSLMSVQNLDSNDDPIYYYGDPIATHSANTAELRNQLYWQGSIASRNTIGGASARELPAGITCPAGVTLLGCAQRYDLDYIRRFTIQSDEGSFFTANNVLFSGGGYCTDGSCTIPNSSDSVIELTGSTIDITNSITDPFYIERDPRLDNYTPPGFNVSAGLNRQQDIRQ